MKTSDGSIPPMLLFRSFLTIASGLVAHQMLLSVATIGLANAFFPDLMQQLNAAQGQGPQLDVAEKFAALPTTLIASIVLVVGTGSVLLGVAVGWVAPFGRLNHAIFLAVIVGVNYLSQSLGAPQEKKVVMMTYLFFFPVAILLGGYWVNRRFADSDAKSLQSETRP